MASGIKIIDKGNFKNAEGLLKRSVGKNKYSILPSYAELGVEALASATPVRSGTTAASWKSEVEISGRQASVNWSNTNVNKNVNIALILQYGHGTGTGGYVPGRDYINPAIQPILDEMADAVWKEVTG